MATRRDLTGAVVAVIGATGGLGRALCARLEARGAVVVAVNRSGSADGRSVDLVADIRDATAGDHIVDWVQREHGHLDGVIIAAGIVAFGNVDDTDDITVEELFLTNSMAPMWLAKRVGDELADSNGFFANISGVVASAPMPGMAAYSASKAAAAAGIEALRREWRRKKVLVVDAQPPHTETGLAARPLAGTAPDMPAGLEPRTVAERIIDAIESGTSSLPAESFS